MTETNRKKLRVGLADIMNEIRYGDRLNDLNAWQDKVEGILLRLADTVDDLLFDLETED